MPVFPSELFDIIIDHLHSDKRTLGACSLVCARFLPTSRYHIFHRLELSFEDHDTFIRLIHSGYVTFPPYVRELLMTEGQLYTKVERKWMNEALSVMPAFVNLKSLEICCFSWRNPTGASFSIPKLFPSLVDICLAHCKFDSFNQMADIICLRSIPSLHSLSIFDSEWGPPSTPFSDLPSPPSLKCLRLATERQKDILEWLLLHEHACIYTRTLEIDTWHPKDMTRICNLLEAIGPSLQDLTLRVSCNNGEYITTNASTS
jgi:hypothetical protein